MRGQAGFAVMPASRHESGKYYEWAKGRAPWEIQIAAAEQWLLDAVEALVGAYGGDQGSGPHERTASPGSDYDAFGNKQDDRERTMRGVVWRGVLEWYRECPIKPPQGQWEARAEPWYEVYERKVTSRIAGVDKREGLQRERRGTYGLLRHKWRATMRHWGSPRMVEHAAKPPPKNDDDEFSGQQERTDPGTGQPLPIEWLDMSNWDNVPVPTRKWAIRDRVPLNQVGLFSGEGGTGKSIIELMKNVTHVLGNKDWLGSIPEQGPAFYLGAEDEAEEIHIRLAAIAKHYGTTFKELDPVGPEGAAAVGQGQHALRPSWSRKSYRDDPPV